MAYIINRYDGSEFTVLQDATVNSTATINLVGRNYIGYGEIQNENFLWLLENFANNAPPSRPISGQTWFNTVNSNLYVYDGDNWNLVGSALVTEDAPESPAVGSFWLKTPVNILYTWTGATWLQVGPEAAEGYDETRAHSTTILANDGSRYPVIKLIVDGLTTGIISFNTFVIDSTEAIVGFNSIVPGYNMSGAGKFAGDLAGLADRASKLDTTRMINGVGFNGTSDITIRSSTTGTLYAGNYVSGSNFDGSVNTTWNVDATSYNVLGKVVARDTSGNFSANTITADLVGDVTGNVNISSGTSNFNIVKANQFIGATLTGNAFSATKLETVRAINGVLFDGTSDITVTAAANTLTGTTLAPNVVNSSLTSVGVLTTLRVGDTGIRVGAGEQLKIKIENSNPVVRSDNGTLSLTVADSTYTESGLVVLNSANYNTTYGQTASGLGGAIVPKTGSTLDIGASTNSFRKIHAQEFIGSLTGNADTATLATRSTNIAGGGVGSIPYQTASGTTTFLNPVNDKVLRSDASGIPYWDDPALQLLKRGNYISSTSDYNGTAEITWSVDATPNDTASKVVARDSNGEFSASKITLTSTPTLAGHAVTKSYVDGFLSPQAVKAWVVFAGSNGTIYRQNNVLAVSRIGNGVYRIYLRSGVFSSGYIAVAGTASDTDHFVVYRSSSSITVDINTVDNGSGNNSPSTTGGLVTVMMAGD